MTYVSGVNLLPATGEFTYGTTARIGQRVQEPALAGINFYQAGGPPKTDFSYAIDKLQADFPDCTTVALVISWFGNSTNAGVCQIYPSTTYVNNGSITNPATGAPWPTLPHAFQYWNGSAYTPDQWRVSGLDETSSGIIQLPVSNGSSVYGGTPSDQSVVEAILDLKARGLRVVFYPFILMTAAGFPWRGRIAYSPDVSTAAANAVASFLGSAAASQFTRNSTNRTVSYSGAATDFTYRRMILHYANLCVVAGGVDLFLLGSEFRGLEAIRGPSWTNAGTTSGGYAVWDYPFVAGLVQLSDDVRGIFDAAGFTKNTSTLKNLISYAADWSAWMGVGHAGSSPPSPNGQWPHLDSLWSHSNIDLVCFDNYLPLSDWASGSGGLDVANWGATAPSSWPVAAPGSAGLGLTGTPTLLSKPYLKANIEGGERFNWFYFDSNNLGRGLDPNGSDLRVSLPEGDRLTQTRERYYAGQEILGQKQIRWWWNNTHRALYDNGDGTGESPKGPTTAWAVNMKSIAFTEYGFPACDRSTNQPNVFFDAKSSESATPYWSVWEPADGSAWRPRADQTLQLMALQAFHEYWFDDTPSNNLTVSGVPMIQQAFCSIWNWDARPFPTFPLRTDVWGDAGNWQAGNWLAGKGPYAPPPAADASPAPGSWPAFPTLAGANWSDTFTPNFTTSEALHVSGKSSRFARVSAPTWDIATRFEFLRGAPSYAELQSFMGFLEQQFAQKSPFTFPAPAALGVGPTLLCRFADDTLDFEEFMANIWQTQTIKLRSVKGE